MGASVCEPIAGACNSAQEELLAALGRLRASLGAAESTASDAAAEAPFVRLASIFRLSPFELDILLLCAGVELDAEFPPLFAAAQNDDRLRRPTFQLLLKLLPEAHWSALLPYAPLRHWKLIGLDASESLTSTSLRIEEPVLHYLVGLSCLDERLDGLVELIDPPRILPSSYRETAEKLAGLCGSAPATTVVHLQGTATRAKRSVAAAACAAAGLRLGVIRMPQFRSALEREPQLREPLIRVLGRDAALGGFALLIDAEDAAAPADLEAAAQLADRFPGFVMLCGSGRFELHTRSVVSGRVDRPAAADQRALWKYALGESGGSLEAEIDRVSTQYAFEPETILKAGRQIREHLDGHGCGALPPGELLQQVCRSDSRPDLDALAQRVETHAGWNAIVLPEGNLETLHAIAAQVRQQGKVLHRWGFASQTSRGLGISALFHGASGTGKTLAAEVLAHELGLDLFRIDLSQVVSKYIGETEKNLRAVFDAASHCGAVLLFDEADALFGKRSEVRDSHDRYANIEVSYLLQRMEAYRGLAILTTNLRAGMDTAFLRRIRFFVPFPFPDQALRRRIWERMFPPEMPAGALDFDKLARLNMPGGNIRNVALNAAYIAADRDEPVGMAHLAIAARRESAKLERPLSEAEIGGWV
jgi:hypothetical protein